MERDAKLTSVADVMTRRVESLTPDMAITTALERIEAWGFTGAPVLDGERLVGVLSERDAVRVLANAAFHGLRPGSVADHMSTEVLTARPEEDVFSAAQRLLSKCVRRLPVVEDGRLVGIVSIADLGSAMLTIQKCRAKRRFVPRRTAGAAWDPSVSRERDRAQ